MSRKLLSFKQCALLCLAFSFSINFYSQTVKDKDYTINYQDKNIELLFDTAVNLSIHDAFSGEEVAFTVEQDKSNAYVLNDVASGKILKLDYGFSGRSATAQSSYVATQSTSTGAINVYFNHAVNTSVATTQNAVNLSNTLDDMLITYINACVSKLDIAIYNSYSPNATTGIAGAINAAYDRGVQIRVIYDGSTSSVMIPYLNPAIPILASPTSSSYGIMHNKFVIFDANSSDASKPFVWTGSTNWTAVQIDGPDKNSVIAVQDQSLALGYTLEFNEMWGSATATPDLVASKFGPYKVDNTPHTYVVGGKVINSYFSPSDGANSKIIDAINSADSDINIATMVITRDDVTTALLNKYNSGLTNINMVIDTQNPSGNDFSVIQAGILPGHAVQYNLAGIMHHKFMVIDNSNSASDPQVLVGSHNWSSSAETKNDENILIVHDANIANQYYQAFTYLYQEVGGQLGVNQNVIATNSLVVYPTITTDLFTLKASNTALDEATVTVYNQLGQKIKAHYFNTLSEETIDLSGQANGMYLVQVNYNGGTFFGKVIKQ